MIDRLGYNSIELHGVPIFNKNPNISVVLMPDICLIKAPYDLSRAMLNAIAVKGIAPKYTGLIIGNTDNILNNYTSEYIDNYSFVLSTAQAILDEFRYRFGYDHKLTEVIDYCEWNEPAIDELPDGEERKYIGVVGVQGKAWKVLHEYLSIDNAIMSWIKFYQENPQLLSYTERAIPREFKNVTCTREQKEQREGIITYWTNLINEIKL